MKEPEDDDEGLPQYELMLHHPDRTNGAVPVRAGGSGVGSWPPAKEAQRAPRRLGSIRC